VINGDRFEKKPTTVHRYIGIGVQTEVDEILKSGLADFSIRQLLGLLISSAGVAERKVYLERTPEDQPNGFYDRRLEVGTTPVEIRVPRTWRGRVPSDNFACTLSPWI
jgi:hypothetical protein